MKSLNFDGQVVVVSGAASGIGKETAKLILDLGGVVIGLDRSSNGLDELAGEVNHSRFSSRVADISNETSLKSTLSDILGHHGQIHALVNTAGVVGPTNVNVEEVTTSQVDLTLRVNLYGAIWMTQAVLPSMKEQKYGRICHVSSIAGKEGNPGMMPYNVSKSGLIGFVKGVSKEVASLGITINAVAPAVIQTPMNSDTSEETLKYMVSRIPMGRLGQASEVASLLSFIVSKECSFTTGFTFDISGGRATY